MSLGAPPETDAAVAPPGGSGGTAPPISLSFALTEAAIWTLVVLATTIGATLSGIDLDFVFGLIGACCGSAVILVVPGALWLKLGPGTVLELDRRVGEAIDIYVNNRLVARGEVVLVEEKLGVTMTEIIKADN